MKILFGFAKRVHISDLEFSVIFFFIPQILFAAPIRLYLHSIPFEFCLKS